MTLAAGGLRSHARYGLEISPPLPPVQQFPSFVDAKRRIFMTATLANDSALITHFAAMLETVATPIVPDSAADLGDRLVLVPQELVPDLSDLNLRTAVARIAVTDNVVVLVPSWQRAEEWREFANEIVSTSPTIATVVDKLRDGPVGLVVIVNEYDGIDLPDNACRVLVIDGLPQAASGSERREATALRDSTRSSRGRCSDLSRAWDVACGLARTGAPSWSWIGAWSN